MARMYAGIAFRRGDVIPIPPCLVLMLMSSWEWIGIASFCVIAKMTVWFRSSKALAVGLSQQCHEFALHCVVCACA